MDIFSDFGGIRSTLLSFMLSLSAIANYRRHDANVLKEFKNRKNIYNNKIKQLNLNSSINGRRASEI